MRFYTFSLLLALVSAQNDGGRVLHWVIRVSNLEATTTFATQCLGMVVLRHEENAEPCPLTCNGVFDTPWSKTMVGYGPENTHYALELTYNYGIDSYEKGSGLQTFIINVGNKHSVDDALECAHEMGYKFDENIITGPDGYLYQLMPSPPIDQSEKFGQVTLAAADPKALGAWYADLLGMVSTPVGEDGSYQLGFAKGRVDLILKPTVDGASPNITQWEGRNAIGVPEATVRAVNERLLKESPELIIHSMRELHEKLGTLFILILHDPAGYEVCLVSLEMFDPSVKEATNYVGPDWDHRKELLAKVKGLQAMDDARKRMFEQMQAAMGGAGAAAEEEVDDEEEDDDDDLLDEDDEEKDEV